MKRIITIIFLLIPVVFTLLSCNLINFINRLSPIEVDMTSTAEAIEMTTPTGNQ